jgi:hypothetical protein
MFRHIYKRYFLLIILVIPSVIAVSQDRERAQQVIKDLCSDEFAGRGYIDKGELKAANYIRNEFKRLKLEPLSTDYFQEFVLDVNTFPKTNLTIDNKTLTPGIDYLVSTNSKSFKGRKTFFYVSSKMLDSKKVARKVKKAVKKGMIPVIPLFDQKNEKHKKAVEEIEQCSKLDVIIYLTKKLTWGVGRNQSKTTEIQLIDSVFDKFAKEIDIDIEANLVHNYKTQNVMGFVPGTRYKDSLIIFCGHYDHLGKMGDATFYGANDNASGIAMLLDMAKYFASNPQKYSVAFIAFGAEEAGLVGSLNYVKFPPEIAPLSKTKFVFNMDLMGSGEAGATIVNSTIFPEYFEILNTINNEKSYLKVLKKRGKAANSDHYFFSEAGVPSFFIYLMGDYTHYHIPQDNPSNLKLGPYYDKSFMLIRDFIISISN